MMWAFAYAESFPRAPPTEPLGLSTPHKTKVYGPATQQQGSDLTTYRGLGTALIYVSVLPDLIH